jgi:hypothetical protein
MINKIEFSANNLTSYAGLYPLVNYTEESGIFQLISDNLYFDNASTEAIKMKHIKTMMALGFVGADKLSRVDLLQNDPIMREGFGVNVTNAENVSRFLYNFSFKTTQMLRDINFLVFKRILKASKLKRITIDIDSTVENVEGNQEGAMKGYNPKKHGNKCYNGLMSFCSELKAFVTGFQRSGNAYTSNGTAEMIKEIIAVLKDDVEDIIFRMDSGYFSEEIIEVIESAGYHYLIKSKHYGTFPALAYGNDNKIVWDEYNDEKQVSSQLIKPATWSKERNFIITRKKKSEKQIIQQKMFEYDEYDHDFYVTNLELNANEAVDFYKKRGTCENYIKESKYDMGIGKMILNSFWANEAIFQIQMLVYNLFLMFKQEHLSENDYWQQIKTFRLKYIFVAAKIVKTGRQKIMKISKDYRYKEVFIEKVA